MAQLWFVSTLGLVLLVLWTADGLLLTKTRVRRDTHRADEPRRILGPAEFRGTQNDAHDHISDMVHGGHRRRNQNKGRNPSRRGTTTTTATSPTTTSSSTTAATNANPAAKPTIVESGNLRSTVQKELSLEPVIHSDRLIPRTDLATDALDAGEDGVVTMTHSTSEGIKVTLRKVDTASETKISKQYFPDGVKSQPECNHDPSQPRLVAGCGDHYLFPGYNVKLVPDSSPCVWHFRYTAPNVIISSTGRTGEQDFGLVIQEGNASNSQDAKAAHARDRYGLAGQIPRDLVIELLDNTNAADVPTEVCVPADPQNAQFDEYDQHEGVCCHTAPDAKCGIPNGSVNDDDFGMQTFPWEAVLTVKMKAANSDEENVTHCSGSLISDEWMLTTAACILRPKNNHSTTTPEISAYFANVTSANYPLLYGTKEFVLYPTSSEAHDIALVRLDSKNPRSPVCLPAYNKGAINEELINQTGTVFGWVVPENATTDHPYMSTRHQRVMGISECSQRLGKQLSPHILCTEDQVTDQEPCLKDGDLLVGSDQYTIVGLSNPRPQCTHDTRQHTSIEHFLPWISSITGIKMRN